MFIDQSKTSNTTLEQQLNIDAADFSVQLVSAVLIKDNRVLLGFRINTTDFPNYWSLPVGHKEPNESFEQALSRELKEELGINVVDVNLIAIKVDDEQSIYHRVYQIADYTNQVVNAEAHLCQKLQWFSFEELPDDITPVSKQILSEFHHQQ